MPHTPLRVAFARPWPGTLRGVILWFFGLAFIILGVLNYIGTNPPPVTRLYLQYPLQLASVTFYGWVFVAVGLASMLSAYCHFDRDRWGYKLLSVWSAVWGFGYVAGWLFSDSPIRAIGSSVIWYLFAAILVLCTRIPNLPFTVRSQ